MRAKLRPLLLVWLVWHLFVMSVDMAKHVSRTIEKNSIPASIAEPVRAFGGVLGSYSKLRAYTEWYQWRIGVHQNWSMFVPNPRLSTTWLEVEGVRKDRTRRALPLIVGEPDPEGAIWTYARAGKHERNAVSGHREKLRMAYTRYYCAKAKAAGDPLKAVEFFAVSVPTPRPEMRADKPREAWPRRRKKLGGWNCPR